MADGHSGGGAGARWRLHVTAPPRHPHTWFGTKSGLGAEVWFDPKSGSIQSLVRRSRGATTLTLSGGCVSSGELLAERGFLDSDRYERDRSYWLRRIDELPPAPELPVREKSSGVTRFEHHKVTLGAAECDALSRRNGNVDRARLQSWLSVPSRQPSRDSMFP